MSRSSVLASLVSQDVSASEFDKLDADNGSDYQGQIDLKSPLASPTFTGSITTPEIRSGSTLTIDPAAVGDNTGLVLLKGNLQVDGTSTTINSTTLTVDDLNLTLASGAADSAAANGAGITIDGASATMTYTHSTTSFDFNKPVNAINTAQITGAEGTSASLYLVADEGDDNGDGWRINSNQDVNDLTISNNTSGSYVDKLTVKSSGEVGIGTTAPTTILHLNGDSPGIKIEEDTDNDYLLIDVVQGGRARIGMNDTRVLTIQENGGFVGIGTTSPRIKTCIETLTDTDVESEILELNNTYSVNQATDTRIRFFATNSNTNVNNRKARIEVTDQGNTTGRDLSINTTGGNVGIGTASPSALLHLSGAHASAGDPLAIIQATDNDHSGIGLMAYGSNASQRNWLVAANLDVAGSFGIGYTANDSNVPTTANVTTAFSIDSSGNVTLGNLKVDTIEGDTLYRSKSYMFFPYYSNYQINTSSTAWTEVNRLQGQWGTGSSIFQQSMAAPGAGFTEKFYLGVSGGSGSGGNANLRIKLEFHNSDGSLFGTSINESQIVSGWHGAASNFHFIGEIVNVSSTSIRSFLSADSNRRAVLYFRNYGTGSSAGNVGISHAWIEQRIYFS